MKSRARQQPAAKASPGRTAVMYVRVSSKEQEQGFSIPAQRQLLKDYAEREGIHVVQEFEDVETAKRAGRTSFTEMVDFLRKKSSGCRTLLVEKTDRLYRNIKDWVTIDELGIEVHFVKEAVVLSEDSRSSEKFMHGIKVLMAKNYIDNLGEEVRKGMIEKARQGHWPTVAPVGYVNNLVSHRIEPDPERAPIIVKLFEWYASGEYSLKVLTKKAAAAGLTNRTGGGALARSRIHQVLQNPVYYGEFYWLGQLHQGLHKPVISRDLYDRVQAVFAAANHPRHTKRRHALAGLVTCGRCGCAFTAEIKKGLYGPNPTPLASRSTFAGGEFELNRKNLVDWILNAPGMIPMQSKTCRDPGAVPGDGCIGMPSFSKDTPKGLPVMTRPQAETIADYLLAER
jgi:DNA invertase Pin-like site-specific DNA recombinase